MGHAKAQKKNKKTVQKGRAEKPVSLRPLGFNEALSGLLATKRLAGARKQGER